MQSLLAIIDLLLGVAFYIIIIQVILSWLVNFDVINLQQRVVYSIWRGLDQLTEPIYRPIRNFLPSAGGLDFAPMIVLLGIIALRIVITNNAF
ncbi:MAG: YggT family protein [Pseudomonadota bacterium]